MPKIKISKEPVPSALVHVRTFPLSTNVIEALGADINRQPYMRQLVHFSLGKMVSSNHKDWISRQYACAIIVPFTPELQSRVHSFHPDDVTFVGDFTIPEGSIVLHAKGEATVQVQGIIYLEVERIDSASIQKALLTLPDLSPLTLSVVDPTTDLYNQDFFFHCQRPSSVNPHCGLGLTMTSSYHEMTCELNTLLLNPYTPEVMLPLVHGLMRHYISDVPASKDQLVASLSPRAQRLQIDRTALSDDFCKTVELNDTLKFTHRLQLTNMTQHGEAIAGPAARVLSYFFNLDSLSFIDITRKIPLPPSLLKPLQYSNLCYQIFRLALRMTLRNKLQLEDTDTDEVITAHLTGPRLWQPLTQTQIAENLKRANSLRETFKVEDLDNDLFLYAMANLMVGIDQFMFDNKTTTKVPIQADALQNNPPGFTFTPFRQFLALNGVTNDPFKGIAITHNIIARRKMASMAQSLTDCQDTLFNRTPGQGSMPQSTVPPANASGAASLP